VTQKVTPEVTSEIQHMSTLDCRVFTFVGVTKKMSRDPADARNCYDASYAVHELSLCWHGVEDVTWFNINIIARLALAIRVWASVIGESKPL